MPRTPTKTDLNTSSLTPVRFTSSSPAQAQNDAKGIRLRLEQITKLLIRNQEKWEAAQRRGLSLCRSIEAIKTKALQSEESDYPQALEPYCSELKVILGIFEDVLASAKTSQKQLRALAALNKASEDIFFRSWCIQHFVRLVEEAVDAYEKEFRIKSIVVEQIAHAKTRPELVLHTSVWEYPAYTDDAFLLSFRFLSVETEFQN